MMIEILARWLPVVGAGVSLFGGTATLVYAVAVLASRHSRRRSGLARQRGEVVRRDGPQHWRRAYRAQQEREAAYLEYRRSLALLIVYAVRLRGRPPQLVLSNLGPGVATGVALHLGEIARDQVLLFREMRARFPLARLAPLEDETFTFLLNEGTPSEWIITCHWTDGAGEHREQQSLPIDGSAPAVFGRARKE